jgi:tRNA pseudouridine55 synthase
MEQRKARKGEAISGVLVLDKAFGQGSTQAVAKTKYLMNAQKAGHGGTLDPLASGVLPILLGDATKFAHDLLTADKTYCATIKLGVTTDSADAEGQVIDQQPVKVTVDQLSALCQQFTGSLSQVPPMHSALKKDGKPLYEYAREGISFELAPRHITIYECSIQKIALPEFTVLVRCSKGTYIRSLARDMGLTLGCGAHLSGLRRIQAGPLAAANAYTLEQLEALKLDQRRQCLLPVDCLLGSLSKVELTESQAGRFVQGQRLAGQDCGLAQTLDSANNSTVRVYLQHHFLGLALLGQGVLRPLRVLTHSLH